jgi:hypothetical protein
MKRGGCTSGVETCALRRRCTMLPLSSAAAATIVNLVSHARLSNSSNTCTAPFTHQKSLLLQHPAFK